MNEEIITYKGKKYIEYKESWVQKYWDWNIIWLFFAFWGGSLVESEINNWFAKIISSIIILGTLIIISAFFKLNNNWSEK